MVATVSGLCWPWAFGCQTTHDHHKWRGDRGYQHRDIKGIVLGYLGESRGSPGRRGGTKSFVKLKVFVDKPKSPVAAKIRLSVVPIDLAATALTMSFWTGRLPPRFTDFVKDESLGFRLGGFGNLDEVPISNRRASIGGQNQKEHEGPNEPFS
ncbi:MAG TPA: hypothetical protein VFS12_15330 [Terriglobia bacterium]|nr:hypothetical protein [Terriglobia bacterium]